MEKRIDATQKNFERFIEQAGGHDIQGYFANNTLVLTTDPILYKQLLQREEEKEQKEIQTLNTCGLRIDKNSTVASWLNCSIFNVQPIKKETYFGEEVGGNLSLIVTNNPSLLKEFVEPLIKRHIEEFDIKIHDGYNNFSQPQTIPPFFAAVTKNNEHENIVCRTELELKNAAPLISTKIGSLTSTENKSLTKK